MKTIRNATREHYKEQTLSKEQLDRLNTLQKKQAPNTFVTFLTKHSRNYFAMAASILVVVLASWILDENRNELAEKVAAEIAYNHSKRMDLEISASELDPVRVHLSELDFNLIESDKASQSQWNLLGGRYCSIQGKLAAQLRVKKNNSDNYHTFYQAIIPDELNLDKKTYSTWVEGTYVELWVEDGVLLGLAGEEGNK